MTARGARRVITSADRAFPRSLHGENVADLAGRGLRVYAGQLAYPAAVIDAAALDHNIHRMASYCAEHAVELAPHGKTTMAPAIFRRQLDAGAWAITAATIPQVQRMREFGVRRIFHANELARPEEMTWVRSELEAHEDFDFYSLVDSVELVEALEGSFRGSRRRLQVLVELGYAGGRTGCRSIEQALEVARRVKASAGLELVGVEGFEGLLRGTTLGETLVLVDGFVEQLRALALRLVGAGLAEGRAALLVSCGGSAYFDRVVRILGGINPESSIPVRVVLRSGCYVVHDSVFYRAASPLGERGGASDPLRPALRIWAAVLSRPEPTLAILGAGKRDLSYDMGFPTPEVVARDGRAWPAASTMNIVALNDQHAHLRLEATDDLRLGDLVALGISHPCLTLDRWGLIPMVDADGVVVDALETFF